MSADAVAFQRPLTHDETATLFGLSLVSGDQE
jgi:hypothetical protein